MVRELSAELLDPAGAELGEGPAWDEAAGCLVWVDILAGALHLTAADGARLATVTIGRHLTAALPAAGGGWLLTAREGFATLADIAAPVVPLLALHDPSVRCNDAKCDSAGRAFSGSMAYALTPGAGALVRLDPGPVATTVVPDVTLGNGLGWSPSGDTMYFVDSVTQTVFAFDYADGTLGARRTFVTVPPELGLPDGLCVDETGGVWVALWGGSAVHRYTPSGRLDTVVRLPVSQVTSCAFGHGTLYITTAASAEPLAGGLFAVSPGTSAPPATPWIRGET